MTKVPFRQPVSELLAPAHKQNLSLSFRQHSILFSFFLHLFLYITFVAFHYFFISSFCFSVFLQFLLNFCIFFSAFLHLLLSVRQHYTFCISFFPSFCIPFFLFFLTILLYKDTFMHCFVAIFQKLNKCTVSVRCPWCFSLLNNKYFSPLKKKSLIPLLSFFFFYPFLFSSFCIQHRHNTT